MGYSWQPPAGYNPHWQPPAGYNPYASHTGSSATQTQNRSVSNGVTPTSDSYATASSTTQSSSYTGGLPTESTGETASSSSLDSLDPNYAGPGFGGSTSNPGAQGDPSTAYNYTGNIGSPPGSNIQVLDQGQNASDYKYTNTFSNSSDKPETINIWNSGGTSGAVGSGQFETPAKSFTLQPGQSMAVAFDTDSHVGWSASEDGTNSGATWGEASFGNLGDNSLASGFDVSQINGSNGNMSITDSATGQSVDQNDAWKSASDSSVGKDVGVQPGPVQLTTVVS